MQEAVFVTELASVQVALKPEVFQACKKSSIVASLVHNRKDSPKVRRLCVYPVFNPIPTFRSLFLKPKINCW